MKRTPEPELMLDPEQARAYAEADFSEPHDRFITLFRERFGAGIEGRVLDLGCGPGDICRRFARAYPRCTLLGVDGSQAMLDAGRHTGPDGGLATRIDYRCGCFPDIDLGERFDILISNSLLHHLHDPQVLWNSLHRHGKPGAAVFVMDLMRPDSPEQAQALVEAYAAGEPDVLRHDFFHSLLAAWRADEVRAQLQQAGLGKLQVEAVSDRHLVVSGRLD